MSVSIQEYPENCTLTSKCRHPFADYSETVILSNNDMTMGSSFFLDIIPDVSAAIIDTIFKEPVQIIRKSSDEDFWEIYYDLSDSFSRHVVYDEHYEIGEESKLNFAILDSKIRSTQLYNAEERFYFLKLYIKKTFMAQIMNGSELEKDFKTVFANQESENFFYGQMDSRSKVILYNLKQQNLDSSNYEFLLKAAVHNLLAHLIERLAVKRTKITQLDKDSEAILQSQQYLLSNLSIPFPGIGFLAEIANMSPTKYRTLYNNMFGTSPALFFKNEKLLLAKELLESGDFKLISDVAYELGYNKTTYFSSIYKEYHGVLPHRVLRGSLIMN
jgi:AraC-like DNA-binding protein